LVFLLIALYVRFKVKPEKKAGKRVLTLMTILCVSCIGWGLLTTSFFGIPFGFDNPIRKVSVMQWLAEKKAEFHISRHDEVWQEWVTKIPALKDVTNPNEFLRKGTSNLDQSTVSEVLNKFTDNILMELALLIGCIHVILSLGRYMFRNWPAIGWILFIIGAYLAIPEFLKATSIIHFAFGVNPETAPTIGKELMIAGLSIAIVLSLIKNKVFGLLEATNVVQIFGDILSYLRLYALGLSGSLLTATINEMAGSLNFVLGAIVLIMGHSVNMILGVMGGVIHGLRLNFLEWYHYSFEGGGKPFTPLHKKKIE
jgi:V/A-type H+-transporting ATPase subunit I